MPDLNRFHGYAAARRRGTAPGSRDAQGNLHPDERQTVAFLDALTGGRGLSTEFTFQTFDDNKERRDPNRARVFRATLPGCYDALSTRNRTGAGVFATINETRGYSRKAQDVIRVRSYFIDKDTPGPLPDLSALPPDIIVASGRGTHAYWLARAGEPLAEFRETQLHLAYALGTDHTVADLPRVMRLPGFFHMKDPRDPRLVQLLKPRVATHLIGGCDE